MFARFIPSHEDAGVAVAGVTYAGNSTHPLWLINQVTTSFAQASAYPDARITTGTESVVMIGIPDDDEFWPIAGYTVDDTGGIAHLQLDSYPYLARNHCNASGNVAGMGIAATWDMAMLPSNAGDIAAFGNYWCPERFKMLVWAASGLPSGQSYTARVKCCYELCVSHITSSYRPFITPPAPSDPEAIEFVRDVYREIPPSIPKAESSPSWWSRLTGYATGVSSFVSQLGIPILSPAAGIAGKFMDMLKL